MSSSYRLELDKWLSQLDVKADTALDLGGAQLPIKGRTKSWDVRKYLIADLPEPHAESLKPDIEIDLNYLYDGDEVADLIFCLEVFEYIWNPVEAVRNITTLLKRNGSAWITFPSFYPLHNPVEDDALRYMPAGIVKLADVAGLSVEQMIKRRPATGAIEYAWSAENMRAAKGEDHSFTGFIVEMKK